MVFLSLDISNPIEWKGNYPVTNDRSKFSDKKPTFRVTYFDRSKTKSERILGGTAKAEGQFNITKVEKGFVEGDFDGSFRTRRRWKVEYKNQRKLEI